MAEVVMSVPHSGTRTLVNYLDVRARPQGLIGAGDWWHFGAHEHLLEKYQDQLKLIHIPIRNPLDVAEGWVCRDKSVDVPKKILMHFEAMWSFVDSATRPPFIVYRMEDLPATHGMGERVEGDWSEEVRELQELVRKHVMDAHPFYQGVYG